MKKAATQKATVKTTMHSWDIDSNTLDFPFRPTAEIIAFLQADFLTVPEKRRAHEMPCLLPH